MAKQFSHKLSKSKKKNAKFEIFDDDILDQIDGDMFISMDDIKPMDNASSVISLNLTRGLSCKTRSFELNAVLMPFKIA